MLINPKGSKQAPCWIIVDRPLSTDKDRGYLFSGGLGMLYSSMLEDAGFSYSDYCIICRQPDTEHPDSYANILGELNQYRPPVIVPLDGTGAYFLDELKPVKKGMDDESNLSKYCGSMLKCSNLVYDHYMIPTYGPAIIAAQYKLRDIIVSCDLGKAKSELEYWKTHDKILEPKPVRDIKIKFDTLDELLSVLKNYAHYDMLSNDIETVYPKAGSMTKTKSQWYKKHPGYPITIGLAPSATEGISFDLFRESDIETAELWRVLNSVLKKVPQLGQNFFNFDINFYEMLGFEINVKHVQDTLIRHHILWPELPHKLQFLTRQYTREPYYKDEGHGWSGKDLSRLKRYNGLDCCVTYEVWEQQEIEFAERPHLR
jgi:hypothetical protein